MLLLASFVNVCACYVWLQKGTVVEKLVEETASDSQHLRQLISICEGKLVDCFMILFLFCGECV